MWFTWSKIISNMWLQKAFQIILLINFKFNYFLLFICILSKKFRVNLYAIWLNLFSIQQIPTAKSFFIIRKKNLLPLFKIKFYLVQMKTKLEIK